MSVPWSNIEVELIIADYFDMLFLELSEKPYSKAEHRRNILPLLNNRSEGAIEFKHQNISAVLINIGLPYIKGYLPRINYQKILDEKVISFLNQNNRVEKYFDQFASKEIISNNNKLNFEKIIVEPPKVNLITEPYTFYRKSPIKINYLEKEQNNRRLGELGEELIIQYEKWKLIKIGKERLADSVEWISKEQGDGAGFDILSKFPNGKDKYVEVKSTKLSKETPFFFSRNELDFSIENASNYHLYRLFNFEDNPKLFIKIGSLDTICNSTALTYKGYF